MSLSAIYPAGTGQQAAVTEPPKPVQVRTVSRTWTLRGVNTGNLLHVSETPHRRYVQITVELNGGAKSSVDLDPQTFAALMDLRDEITGRWDADQTIEALGK